MCVYIYIYIYTHTCVYTYKYIYIYIYVCNWFLWRFLTRTYILPKHSLGSLQLEPVHRVEDLVLRSLPRSFCCFMRLFLICLCSIYVHYDMHVVCFRFIVNASLLFPAAAAIASDYVVRSLFQISSPSPVKDKRACKNGCVSYFNVEVNISGHLSCQIIHTSEGYNDTFGYV